MYASSLFQEQFISNHITFFIQPGTPPEVLWITADPSVPIAGEELRLNCRINNFSPNVIRVNWFQDGEKLRTDICHSVSVVGTNGLYSMWSLLRVTPMQGAEKTVFTCRVEHGALREHIERSYTLQMPGEPFIHSFCKLIRSLDKQRDWKKRPEGGPKGALRKGLVK